MKMEDDDGGRTEEELHTIIEEALQRSSVKVVELLSPAFVLDLFMEKNLFGEMTKIIVQDIRAISMPSKKNSEIHKKISVDPTRYPVFKECLAETRQTDLIDVLEKAEDAVHAKMKENGRCSTCKERSTDPCTMLASLKCNLDFQVSKMFTEAESVIRKAIQRSTPIVTTKMKPDAVLELFEERFVFGACNNADDIRAINVPSEKSRAIYDRVSRDWRLYLVFKECLAATSQINLLNALEEIEEDLHAETKGKGGCCICNGKDTCQMMASLRCDRDIPQYLPPMVRGTQKHLIDLYKQNCMKVPIYPLIQEEEDFVEKIFVVPNMLEMETHDVKNSADQKCSETKEQELIDIRGIFYANDKLRKDIYLVAESGTGKSTLCEYLVHLWVKEHSKMEGDRCETNDKSFMQVFALLFYVSLRDAQGTCIWDMENMIKSQLDLENVDVSKMFLNNTCLIILDGLDEYSLKHKKSSRFLSASLPWRKPSKSTVLTTSRPWKMEVLAREKGVTIDRQIRITGLGSQSQGDLAKNVIKILNVERQQDKQVVDFIDCMEEEKLDKQMETPILLMQMLGLWFDGESFGKSQCEIYSKMIEKQIQFAVEIKKIEPQSMAQRISAAPSEDEHHSTQFPACLSGKRYCYTCQGLLLKLPKLAYHFLFGRQECALVFDYEEMEIKGLSEGEIQSCLHLGLLTQYKVLGKKTQRQKSISFVHKSHQEFFAAVYLWQTGFGSELKKLLVSFTDLDRALQVEKVLLYVSGMNTAISCEIAEVIMTVASSDSRIQHYQESCLGDVAPETALVKQIQGVILAAIEESRNNELTMPAILLQDIWMKDGRLADRHFSPGRILACKQYLQLHHVTSIYIESQSDIPHDVIWRMVKDCSPQLTKLVLVNCDISASMLQEVVERNNDSLQTMGLYNYKMLDLSPLDEATLTKIVSPLSLGLDSVNMSHKQLEFVYKHLGQRPHRQVLLQDLCCNLHDASCEEEDSCEPRLDLSASSQLNTLKLKFLPVQEVKFKTENLLHCELEGLSAAGTASAVRSLRHARSLHTFDCRNYTEYATVSQELVTTLPQLDALRRIRLVHIDMTYTQQHVFPDHMKTMEIIKLDYVKLRAKQLIDLLAALPSHRVVVDLYRATITDYDRNDDIIEQTAASKRTEVRRGPCVTYEHDKCIVEKFWFYHTK